jgi:hypothetical protein
MGVGFVFWVWMDADFYFLLEAVSFWLYFLLQPGKQGNCLEALKKFDEEEEEQ